MSEKGFEVLLIVMAALGVAVFASLWKVTAGYGKFASKKWGPSISNRAGWVLMEVPVFLVMLLIWALNGFPLAAPQIVLFGLFMLHYTQRCFVFPFLIRGKSRMPLSIMGMGVVFNLINGYIQGAGLFLFPRASYSLGWGYLLSWNAILGMGLFAVGLAINWNSDYVIRHLRRPGDTAHYLPQKGLYKYVTNANYLGEILEWVGFALAAASPAGWVFAWWTAANLVPRADSIHKRYIQEFGTEALGKRKRLLPFVW